MTVRRTHLPFEMDGGVAPRARLGLISLATDYTVEADFQAVTAGLPGVALYTSRIPMAGEVSPETLAAMKADIPAAAGLLLPGEPFDAIAYGCSSATAVLGEDQIARLVGETKPGAPVTNPVTAVKAAMAALGVRRIGVLTPYVQSVNDVIEATLTGAGLEVAAFASFDEPIEAKVGVISPASIRAGVETLCGMAEFEAVFVSCTNLRAAEIVADLEASIGRAVTSSNHAMIWHSLRLAGISDRMSGLGRLYETG